MTPVQGPARRHRRSIQLRASDIMTSPVITARVNTPIKDLVALMTTHRISGIPIVIGEEKELIGIVTEADLLHKEVLPKSKEPAPLAQALHLPGIVAAVERARKTEGLRADEIMTAPVVTVTEAATVHEIAGLMVRHKINRIPVLRAGKVVGIVSRADILKAFTRTDQDLAETIREGILHDLWIDPSRVKIAVKDGVVDLEGVLDRRSEKELVERWAEMADGVLGVRSRLTYEVDDRKTPPELPRK